MFADFRSTASAFGFAAGVALALVAVTPPAEAGGCGATCFMGGMMAGRVLSQHQEMQRQKMQMEQEQTQAMQQMATQGGGGYGYNGGYVPPPPAYGYGYRRY